MGTGTYEHIGNTGVCAATGRKLEPGETVVAALCDSAETEALTRLDFSVDAWENGARPPEGLEAIGVWRTTVPEPNAKKSPIVGAGELMDLFEQLEDATEPRTVALRYIIALQLMRKKRLLPEGTKKQPDGGETMLVRRRGDAPPPEHGGDGPELLEVIDPRLDEGKLAELMDELDAVLTPEAGGK